VEASCHTWCVVCCCLHQGNAWDLVFVNLVFLYVFGGHVIACRITPFLRSSDSCQFRIFPGLLSVLDLLCHLS